MKRLLFLVPFFLACHAQEESSLLVVNISKDSNVPVLNHLIVQVGTVTRVENGDAPMSIGAYLPSSFSGVVHVQVWGDIADGHVAQAATDSAVSPGQIASVSVRLALITASPDGGLPDGGDTQDSERVTREVGFDQAIDGTLDLPVGAEPGSRLDSSTILVEAHADDTAALADAADLGKDGYLVGDTDDAPSVVGDGNPRADVVETARPDLRVDGETVERDSAVDLGPDSSGPCLPPTHDNGTGQCVTTGCAGGYHDGGDGACVLLATCSPGYHNNGAGSCIAVGCASGYHDGGDAVCVAMGTCSAGYHDNGQAVCVASGCAVGYHDGGAGACVLVGTCSTSFHDNGLGTCVATGCASGYHDGGAGACVPTGSCSTGFHDNGLGTCIATGCASGYHDGGAGACVPTGNCSTGYHDDGNGACVSSGCASGYHDGGTGTCVLIGTCSTGYHDGGAGTCVISSTCSTGFHLCGTTCSSNSSINSCGIACSPCVPPSNAVSTCDGTACGSHCLGGYVDCGSGCVLGTACGEVRYGYQNLAGSNTFTADNLLGEAIDIPQPILVTKLAVSTAASGPHVVVGLYTNNGGVPNTLVASTPSTAVSFGANEIAVTASKTITAGTYWLMAVYDKDAQIEKDSATTNTFCYISFAFSASLPTTWPGGTSYQTGHAGYYVVGIPQ